MDNNTTTTAKPRTSATNGRLWGARHRDWADIQEALMKDVYTAVLDRTGVGRGTWYCDVGCGSGLAVSLAAQRGANVSGLDAAANLLGIARERAPNADLRQGDIEDLPFENGTFDVVTGFNSFQYAGNPVTALQEARRIAKPGGHVVIMTWGPPEGMQAASLVAALKPLLPPPPPGAPGPFALSDKAALTSLVESAGLKPIDIVDVECPWRYPDLPTALRGLGSSGVAVRAAENTSWDAVNKAHAAAVAPFAKADGSYEIKATFRYLLAGV
jgi:SAM-dependent methyltransferase